MLSLIVLTRNESKHIAACLESVRGFADEVVVLDSGSTDDTLAIAKGRGARIAQRPFDNYPSQRNAAIEIARGDWFFFVDADERATPALGREVKQQTVLADERRARGDTGFVGFWVPRNNIIFGKWIRHTGWSPDFQPRILKRGFGKFDPRREVHELLNWDGPAGFLNEALVHYNYDNLSQFRLKQIQYTRFEARDWYQQGRRARLRGFIGQPLREFLRRYITLRGWRDGAHGLLLSALMAYYAFVRQSMLWKLQRSPEDTSTM